MGIEKITEQIKSSCGADENMKNMLLELFTFQLEDKGWWKDSYKEIIHRYAKENKDNDAD